MDCKTDLMRTSLPVRERYMLLQELILFQMQSFINLKVACLLRPIINGLMRLFKCYLH